MRHFSLLAAPLALTLSCALVPAVHAQAASASVTAASPDGTLVVSVTVDNDGRPAYTLTRKGKLLVGSSMLGFIVADGQTMVRGNRIVGSEKGSGKETWEQPWGERRFVTDDHNDLVVKFEQNADWGGRRMNVRFRLFNDGFGLRYELPEQPAMKTMKIADELTEFAVAQNGTAWWIPGGEWNRYEQVYQKSAIDAVSTAHTPITMKLDDGTHLAFHEAALVDYSAMWLKRISGTTFRSTLSPSSSGPKVVRDLPFNTPWRTIRIADSAKGLVENDLELNLNEPNKLGDVSWFKPMKYIGIWWGMIRGDWSWAEGPNHGATTARTKQYIDFAAKHGFGGVLVEGWDKGWNGSWFGNGADFSFTEATPDFDLKAVTSYAAKKRVQ
ncbi:MAG: alpha-glucosidase, partial [Novosphingobium sp.]|nr:alpha-glucosidase [Novosphingobium sp.]